MLPSGLPEAVGDDEDLARFLTSSGQFNTSMAKPAAFLPHPTDRETSVFRHGREPLDVLWRLGREHVAGEGRPIRAVAVFKARTVREESLDVVPAEPPARHAVIVGWPWLDDPELQKAQQKERAAVLAQRSELVR